jgi:hypothetical protein
MLATTVPLIRKFAVELESSMRNLEKFVNAVEVAIPVSTIVSTPALLATAFQFGVVDATKYTPFVGRVERFVPNVTLVNPAIVIVLVAVDASGDLSRASNTGLELAVAIAAYVRRLPPIAVVTGAAVPPSMRAYGG